MDKQSQFKPALVPIAAKQARKVQQQIDFGEGNSR